MLVGLPSFLQAGGDIDVSYSQKVTDRSTTSVAEDDPWFKVNHVPTQPTTHY